MKVNPNVEYSNKINKNKNLLISLIKPTVVLAAALLLLLAVCLIVELIGPRRTVKLEAGEALPSAASISGHSDAKYQYDLDVSSVGEYDLCILYGKNGIMKLRIKVSDTKAPLGKVKDISVHNGSPLMPDAKDFFDEIYDASAYTASFVEKPVINGMGSYAVVIRLADEHENEQTYYATLHVIDDTEKPTLVATSSIIGYVGEGIAYKSAVEISDNCFGVSVSYDDSDVDTTKAGEYLVTYIVTDAAGNKIEAIVPVIIHEMRITADILNEQIEKIAKNQGMTKSLSKEELCRRIYAYVNDPRSSADGARFRYVGFSNDETRTDWRAEAYLTIKNGQGDCYSYFALSKAFFEYFGIENRDIERTKGLTKDTHFWNMVNIGSAADPRWYFFDATRYAGRFELGGNNGCLLTAKQLESYKPNSQGYGDNYYKFDSASYPEAETKIINESYRFD